METHWESKSGVDNHPVYSYSDYAQRERDRGNYPCEYCGSSFYTDAELQEHLINKAGWDQHPGGEAEEWESSTSEKGYQWCNYCNHKCRGSDGLQSHKWQKQ